MRAFALLLPFALLAGCADSGPYPSLAQRPIERELPPPDVEPAGADVPDDPALAARIADFTAEARKGQAEFDAAFPAAEAAARRGGAAGSDSWTRAQEALSRAQAAAATTNRALVALDAWSVDAARAKPVNPGDLARLQAAVDAVQRIADDQHARIARLEAMLSAP
jgi:hypothetical protein